MKIENMKKVKLGEYPTPLEKLENLTKKYGKSTMYIKRDDATGPAFGGNKARKLEYVMKEAIDEGYTVMITVGGPQTNHGRTTVAAAVKFGMKPVLVLRGPAPKYLSGNLTLDAMMGAELVFAGDDMDGAVKATIEKYEKMGEKPYFLPSGGSGKTGVAGYIMTVPELMKQFEEMKINPKYVVCAVGSLGTYGGLNLGVKYFNAPFKILGVPVSPKEEDPRIAAAAFMNEMSEHYEMGIHTEVEDLIINNGPEDAPYSGEQYNKPDPLTRKYMFELASEEGIILDPTYTGKAFRGFIDMIENGTIGADDEVVFLHTGGAVAVWTKEHLDDMQQELFDNCEIIEM
jgi:1-aminocyclopropane-1-carboxylate deaminase